MQNSMSVSCFHLQQVSSYAKKIVKEKKVIAGAPGSSGHVEDGIVGLHGDWLILKAKTRGWKACAYILGTILLHSLCISFVCL